ncbi:hypothetical protein DRO59_06080 [Candidatus Bathyarchaeota archaeon]|nr:MAG: hypothetical protein DRO59_06080 [Candidatus Bathyarchaeota archaeon]
MSQVLTRVMARAVSGVQVDSAAMVKVGTLYWIWVEPDHYGYWCKFENVYLYPYQSRVIRKCGIVLRSADAVSWPTSSTREGLIKWLSNVLKLSCGEYKLLLLDVGL